MIFSICTLFNVKQQLKTVKEIMNMFPLQRNTKITNYAYIRCKYIRNHRCKQMVSELRFVPVETTIYTVDIAETYCLVSIILRCQLQVNVTLPVRFDKFYPFAKYNLENIPQIKNNWNIEQYKQFQILPAKNKKRKQKEKARRDCHRLKIFIEMSLIMTKYEVKH